MDETSVADLVLKRFGGLNALARALGKPVSTVQGWRESGTIHPRNWPEIEQAAFRAGFFDITARKLGEMHANQETRKARDEAAAGKPIPKKTSESAALTKGAP